MGPSNNAVDNNKPGFVLLENAVPLDRVSNFLLGCVVSDMRNPTEDFQPEGNYHAFQEYIIEVFDKGYSAFVESNTDRSLEGRIGTLVGVTDASKKKTTESFDSTVVRTKTLMQHPEIFKQVMSSKAKANIVELMERNGGKGYLVVGFKSALDAKHAHTFENTRRLSANIRVPAREAVKGGTQGAVDPGDAVDPQITYTDNSGQRVIIESTMMGERIIAVRYRLLTLRGLFAKEVKSGEIVRVNVGAGVFAGHEASEDVVFDEDDDESLPAKPDPGTRKGDEGKIDISTRRFEDDLEILGYQGKWGVVY